MSNLQSYEVWRSVEDSLVTALIAHDAVQVMQAHAQLSPILHEAGGILIGATYGADIQVIEATAPLLLDKRSRTGFYRKDKGHFDRARQLWKQNGREVGYVGEWHTHPEDHPQPSGTDLNQWHSILEADKAPRLFVIIGRVGKLVMYGRWNGKVALKRLII